MEKGEYLFSSQKRIRDREIVGDYGWSTWTYRCFRRTINTIGARRLPARGQNEMLSDNALIWNILGCIRREVVERRQRGGRNGEGDRIGG